MKESVSLICCFNNLSQYKNLEASLKDQTIEYELVGIDNRIGKYKSASSALNAGAQQAKGEILVFLHQDIIFEKVSSLKELVRFIPKYKNSIIGLFGAAHRVPQKTEDGLYEVETLDECCVAMSRSTWESLRFNEELCDGWHLYVVEMCLRARNNIEGMHILYGCFNIKHLSTGTVDENYMKTYKKLLITYKKNKWIYTTCKKMPASLIYYNLYYAVWKLKKLFFGNIPVGYTLKHLFK